MNSHAASRESTSGLLVLVSQGDGAARGQLFDEVYTELRERASIQRRRWMADAPLDTTALINEAYLKLVERDARSWSSRSHFFAVAATAMRYILINWARKERAQKRGGRTHRISLDELRDSFGRETAVPEETAEALVVLEEALCELGARFPRAAQGVECRFFGNMTIAETAEALGVSETTVSRDWAVARSWLYREMKRILENDRVDERD